MAQNITLLGANYSDVPAVQLPKTGGGTATFTDVTDTTAAASDVASGKYFYTAAGVKTEGTASGGGGSVIVTDEVLPGGGIAKHITAEVVNLQSKSVTPSETAQTITPDTGYNGLSEVTVAAMPSGTAGTPTATKGSVSNHSISVTPSVTNTAGYIAGGTKTGTSVNISASELVSGSETITQNGTVDVTNLASVTVNVSGSGGKNIQVNSNAASVRTNGYTASSITLTVAKAGTYKVSWTAWRSSSQGTMGTNLHVNNTTGTNQQTFTNTYGQHITLSNQQYNQGDVLTLYGTSGSTSRYIWISNLIIEEQ